MVMGDGRWRRTSWDMTRSLANTGATAYGAYVLRSCRFHVVMAGEYSWAALHDRSPCSQPTTPAHPIDSPFAFSMQPAHPSDSMQFFTMSEQYVHISRLAAA